MKKNILKVPFRRSRKRIAKSMVRVHPTEEGQIAATTVVHGVHSVDATTACSAMFLCKISWLTFPGTMKMSQKRLSTRKSSETIVKDENLKELWRLLFNLPIRLSCNNYKILIFLSHFSSINEAYNCSVLYKEIFTIYRILSKALKISNSSIALIFWG